MPKKKQLGFDFMTQLIGFSLSFCISDILKGIVQLDKVACIIANTRIKNGHDWESCISFYTKSYWHNYNWKEIDPIVDYIWQNNLLIQPRLIFNPGIVRYYEDHISHPLNGIGLPIKWVQLNKYQDFRNLIKSCKQGESVIFDQRDWI